MKKNLFLLLLILSIDVTNAQCWKAVSGGRHSLGLKTTDALWGWGANSYGQLGNGFTSPPTNPSPWLVPNSSWSVISGGEYFSLGIKTDGTLWAWGQNSYGQLGNGTTTNTRTPVKIGLASNWVAVSCKSDFALALKADGTLWAWGHNNVGQLGDGTLINRSAPVRIGTATNWLSISAGQTHALALKTNGTLWSWGNNIASQLGDGTIIDRNTPGQVGIATNWVTISAGDFFSLGIQSNGTLWSWGFNGNGECGQGAAAGLYVPTQVGNGINWRLASAGVRFALALQKNGTLWSWGADDYGQLGQGTTNGPTITSPVQIGNDADWVQIHAAFFHSMAIKSDGSLKTWGSNFSGCLGDGSLVSSGFPVSVGCPLLNPDTGINDYAQTPTGFLIYPNPVKDFLYIKNESEVAIKTMSVTNLLGELIFESADFHSKIDLQSLKNGIYFVMLTTEKGSASMKFIKE